MTRGEDRSPGRRRAARSSGPVEAERVYELRVGDRVLRLDADGLISYVRRLHCERELGLAPGALTDENDDDRKELT